MTLIAVLLALICVLTSVLMAAPAPTARTLPTGVPEPDATGTKITFSAAPGLAIWEESVTPPGITNGDAINMTNMFNVTWQTKRERVLKEMTDGSGVYQYKSTSLAAIYAVVGVNMTITITFRDGTQWAFYGYLKEFLPQERKPGEKPTANGGFVVTNWDPVNGVESGPVGPV